MIPAMENAIITLLKESHTRTNVCLHVERDSMHFAYMNNV